MKLDEYLDMKDDLLFFADEKKKGSLKYYIKWYSERHPFYRIAYRVSGLLMIIFAFFTPLWVTGDKSGQAFLAGVGTFIVSIATFYSFKHAWSGYYLAQYNLEVLNELYLEKVERAKLMTQDDERTKALDLVIKATEDLIKQSAEVINAETKGYFASTNFPSIPVLNKSNLS